MTSMQASASCNKVSDTGAGIHSLWNIIRTYEALSLTRFAEMIQETRHTLKKHYKLKSLLYRTSVCALRWCSEPISKTNTKKYKCWNQLTLSNINISSILLCHQCYGVTFENPDFIYILSVLVSYVRSSLHLISQKIVSLII